MKFNTRLIPGIKLGKKKGSDFSAIEDYLTDLSDEEMLKKVKEDYKQSQKEAKGYPGTHYKTVKEFFNRSTTMYEDRPFILDVFKKRGPFEEVTYGQFRQDVLALGTALTKVLNIEGEKIVILSETTYEWYVSYTAVLLGAGIAVPIDKELPENELESLITRSGAKAVITSAKKYDLVHKAVIHTEPCDYLIKMYSDEEESVAKKDAKMAAAGHEFYNEIGFEHLKQAGKVLVDSGDNSLMEKEIEPDAFAVLIFTSGTTSASKGVMISNHNLAANINAITPFVDLRPEDRLFSVLPLHHTYESTIGFLYPMAVGASVAVCQGLKHIVDNMKETNPTAIIAVPLLIETLYNRIQKSIAKQGKTRQVELAMSITNKLARIGINAKRAAFDEIYQSLGGNLRIIVSAAAPIDKKVGEWFRDLGICFMQGYGLTETAPIAALTPDYDLRVGSAGKAVYGDEIMVNEPNEQGEGEIWIKGETLMLGYYNNAEATEEVMHGEWFNSGDIGYMDEDGFIYITGRSKNVIVTQNGKNIYPEEVETLLNKCPEIKECMVYGKEIEGEKELIVTARVIPDLEEIAGLHPEIDTEDDDQVYKAVWDAIRQVNRQISNYKCVKALEIKHDEFVKTSTMKIKRYAELKK